MATPGEVRESSPEADTSSAVPQSTGDAAALTLPAPPKPASQLVAEALSDKPQSSAEVHQTMCAIADGAYAVPSLKTVQSALSSRGDKFGDKVQVGRFLKWVRKEPSSRSSIKKGSKKQAKRKAEQAKKVELAKQTKLAKAAKAAAEARKASGRVEELLARPLSAFQLFGMSQRGALKRQSTAGAVKEAVKAIGERWLLLGEEERAKYEAMALEDGRRAERAALAREEAEAAAAAAAEAEAAAAAEGDIGDESGGEVDDEDVDVDGRDATGELGGAESGEGEVIEPDELPVPI